MIVSSTGVGVIGCTNTEVLLADGSGCGSVADISSQFAVDVTQPPYNAKCDGTTDDHIAIQAALDNNTAIMIPKSSTGPTECMLGTVGVTMCSAANHFGYNALYGNGQLLGYTGSGSMITIGHACDTVNSLGMNRVQDLYIDAHTATGNPIMVDVENSWHLVLSNIDDEIYTTLDPNTYTSLKLLYTENSGAEGFSISGFLGSAALVMSGVNGSEQLGSFSITGSQFGSMQASDIDSASVDGTIFGEDGKTTTIYDALSFSINGSQFSGAVVAGSIDGGGSSINADAAQFFSSLAATGNLTFNGKSVVSGSATLPIMAGAYNGEIQGDYDPGSITPFDEVNGKEVDLTLLSGTYTDTQWCNYDATGDAINCDNPAPQVNLSLMPGTYVNGDICTYDSAGTVINCNTPFPVAGGTATLGSCGTGSPALSGTTPAFNVTGIAAGTTSCTVTFSPSLTAQVCTMASNGTSAPNISSLSGSTLVVAPSGTSTILYVMCK